MGWHDRVIQLGICLRVTYHDSIGENSFLPLTLDSSSRRGPFRMMHASVIAPNKDRLPTPLPIITRS